MQQMRSGRHFATLQCVCDRCVGMYAYDAFMPFARANAITLYVYICDYGVWVWCTLVYMQPLPVNGLTNGKTDLVPSFFLNVSVTFRCLKNVPFYRIADMKALKCGLYFSFRSLSKNLEKKKNAHHTTLSAQRWVELKDWTNYYFRSRQPIPISIPSCTHSTSIPVYMMCLNEC